MVPATEVDRLRWGGSDPLAVLLYLIARNALPWGHLEKLVHTATGEIVPDLPADDPVAEWARATADELRQPPTGVVP